MMLLSFFTDASWENLHVVWHKVRLADAKYQPLHACSLLMGFWSNLFIFPQKHLLRPHQNRLSKGILLKATTYTYYVFHFNKTGMSGDIQREQLLFYANSQKACASVQSDQSLSICTHHLWGPKESKGIKYRLLLNCIDPDSS